MTNLDEGKEEADRALVDVAGILEQIDVGGAGYVLAIIAGRWLSAWSLERRDVALNMLIANMIAECEASDDEQDEDPDFEHPADPDAPMMRMFPEFKQ